MVSLLCKYKDNILKYLFDSSVIDINSFESNKEVKLNERWDLILNYPNELHILKRSKITRINLIERVTDILLKNVHRSIHPILLIIFYYELKDYIKYTEMSKENEDDETQIQLTSKNKKYLKELRPQINKTFRLYWKLLNDKKIKAFANYYIGNDLVEELINSLYYKVSVEELIKLNTTIIETKKVRFNDLCFCLDIDNDLLKKNTSLHKYEKYSKIRESLSDKHQDFQNKILIEINESHHLPSIDFIRKTNIYESTGKTVIDYNINDDDIETVYLKILKEISKLIYKNYDENLGIIFYLTNVEHIDISIAKFFLDIYNDTTTSKKGIEVKRILDTFNIWEFVDKKKFLKLVKNELDNEQYFIEQKDDLKNSLLSSLGVDRLIFLPRKSDFVNCEEIIKFVKMYNKFREGFFRTVEAFLNNDDENNIIIYLLRKLICKDDYEKFKQPLIDSFLEKILNEDLKEAIEKTFNIELDKYLPILKKSNCKFHNIDTTIMKNSFGDKVSNILEERFDIGKSEIKKRVLIPNEVINFVIKYKK